MRVPLRRAKRKHKPGEIKMKMTLACTGFTRMRRNTLIGFCEIKVAELQLVIKDIALHEKGKSRWAALPSKPMTKGDVVLKGDDNKIRYVPILQFANREVADAFSAAAIRAVLEHSPDAFDDAPTETKASRATELDDAIPF
jgi:hypothetical protein